MTRTEHERAPAPLAPTAGARRLESHVDPHVGESIQRRASVQSGRVGHGVGHAASRAAASAHRRAAADRYALDDLKRLIVMAEILGPPLALRRGEREF